MKTDLFLLLSATIGQASAQFFVLYGRDTVVQRADPILYPGKVGQHVHEFVGAGNLVPNSNFPQLRSADCSSLGRANGNPIVEDKSAYWHPALYVKANNGSYIRVPTNGRQVYYKNAGTGTMRDPFEFPVGFRMIAGNTDQRKAASHSPTNLDEITQWICHESVWNQGTGGGFPTGVTSCPDYPFFNGAIHFPHCWNGKAFNISAPTAHMAYPLNDIENGACPSTHPTRLPHIFMENNFDLTSLVGQFQENTFVLAQGDPTGFGWHADFFNGWKVGTLPKLLSGSTACSSHDVGDCTGVTFDSSMNVADCQAPLTYKEDVDGPLDGLPGCNPITTTVSKVKRVPCAVGVVGGTGAAASAAPSSVASASSKLSSYASTVTAIKSATSQQVTTSKASASSVAAKKVNEETVTVYKTRWATKTVTVTGQAATTHKKRSTNMGQLFGYSHGHARRHDF